MYIFELIKMHVNHLEVHKNFKKGFFSFQKLNKEFYRMNIDQVHEQNNKVIKATGGATDLVNKREIHHWFVGKHAPLTLPESSQSLRSQKENH